MLALAAFACLTYLGLKAVILPVFHNGPVASDAFNHVALTTAALDTLAKTHALPLASDAILEGREYPYFLFGNGGFTIVSAIISWLLHLPPYLGDALVLSVGFACGAFGTFLQGRRAELHTLPALVLGLLYAAGPFPSFDLFIRGGFPQYLAWEALPILTLLVAKALEPRSGPLALLAGAAALGLPFYIHKLVAPHVIVALLLVALTTGELGLSSVWRLAFIGVIAILWSVPAWHPTVAGQTGLVLADPGIPPSLNHTLSNLLWPFAQDSLQPPGAAPAGPYFGHYALQVGVIPLAGAVLAILACILVPRRALRRGLPLLLALFALYIALIMGWQAGWGRAPAYFRYLETTARIIGVAHFLGTVLLLRAAGMIAPRVPALPRRVGAATFLAAAAVSCATYWYAPAFWQLTSSTWPVGPADYTRTRPADISNSDSFLLLSQHSNLLVGSAAILGTWIYNPPLVIPVPADAGRVILRATAPDALFASGQPLTVDVLAAKPADPTEPAPGADDARTLAGTTLTAPGPFELQAALDSSVAYIAIRCSRSAPAKSLGASPTDTRPVCLHIDQLVVPNEADTFVQPKDIPLERQQRGAFGTTTLDMRGLRAGEYLLPTFYFRFVRLQDSAGRQLPVYQYDRVAAFKYDGHSALFTVWYDLQLEIGAVLGGAGIFVLYLLGALLAARWRRSHRYAAVKEWLA